MEGMEDTEDIRYDIRYERDLGYKQVLVPQFQI